MHEVIVVVRSKNSFARYADNLQTQTKLQIRWNGDESFELGNSHYYCVMGISDIQKLVNHQEADVVFAGSIASWASIPGIDYLRGLAERRKGMETYQTLSNNMQSERNVDALLSRNEVPRALPDTDLLDLARQTLKKIAVAHSYGVERNCVESTLLYCSEEAKKVLGQISQPEVLPVGKSK